MERRWQIGTHLYHLGTVCCDFSWYQQLSKTSWAFVLLQVGSELLSSGLCAPGDVQAGLWDLSNKWEELNCKMAEHGEQLRRARQRDQLLGLLQVSGREKEGTGGRRRLGWAGNRLDGEKRGRVWMSC